MHCRHAAGIDSVIQKDFLNVRGSPVVQKPEPKFVVSRGFPSWIIAAGGIETLPAKCNRRMTKRIAKQQRPTNVDISFWHAIDRSVPAVFIDVDEIASEDRDLRISIERGDEMCDPLGSRDIVRIEPGNDISASLTYSSISSPHWTKIYRVRKDADARVPRCLSDKDITLSRAVIDKDQLEIVKGLVGNAFDRGVQKPQVLISDDDHRYARMCESARNIT